MSIKIIGLVSSCKECPNREYYSSGIYQCSETGETLAANSVIPGWCPLSNYPTTLPIEITYLRAEVLRQQVENVQIRELMNCYNLGGWTDSLALINERDELLGNNANLTGSLLAYQQEIERLRAAAINPEGASGFTFAQRAKWAYMQADAMIEARNNDHTANTEPPPLPEPEGSAK